MHVIYLCLTLLANSALMVQLLPGVGIEVYRVLDHGTQSELHRVCIERFLTLYFVGLWNPKVRVLFSNHFLFTIYFFISAKKPFFVAIFGRM